MSNDKNLKTLRFGKMDGRNESVGTFTQGVG